MQTITSAGLLAKISDILFNALNKIFTADPDKKEAIKDSSGNLGGRYWFPLVYDKNSKVVIDVYPIDTSSSVDDKDKKMYLIPSVRMFYTFEGKEYKIDEMNIEQDNFRDMATTLVNDGKQDDVDETAEILFTAFKNIGELYKKWTAKTIEEPDIQKTIQSFLNENDNLLDGLDKFSVYDGYPSNLLSFKIGESDKEFWMITKNPSIQEDTDSQDSPSEEGVDTETGDNDSSENIPEGYELRDGNLYPSDVETDWENASHRVKLGLKRIVGSSKISITHVSDCIDPMYIKEVVDRVSCDPVLVSKIADSEVLVQAYGDDPVAICEIDHVDRADSCRSLFDACVGFMSNLYAVLYGSEFDMISPIDDALRVSQELTKCSANMMKRECNCYPNPGLAEYECIDNSCGFSAGEAADICRQLCQDMIDIVNMYMCTIPTDYRSGYLELLDDLKYILE